MRNRSLALLVIGLLGLGFASTAEAAGRPLPALRVAAAGKRKPPVTPAVAEPSAKLFPISMHLLLGYGVSFTDTDADGTDINVFGFGFGAAGGYEFANLYLGARCMFFLGDSSRLTGLLVSRNEMTLGLEAGYTLHIDRFSVRPELGFGFAIGRSERETTDAAGLPVTEDDSAEDFYGAAGIALLYDVTTRVFVGLDAQAPMIFAERTIKGLTFLANIGMRF